jgi:hypothetical protein
MKARVWNNRFRLILPLTLCPLKSQDAHHNKSITPDSGPRGARGQGIEQDKA